MEEGNKLKTSHKYVQIQWRLYINMFNIYRFYGFASEAQMDPTIEVLLSIFCLIYICVGETFTCAY